MSFSSIRDISFRRWFFPLWLCGCVVSFFQVALISDTSMGEGFEPLAVARSLVAGEGFANPYWPLATGPTAHVAPVYPAIVAGAIHLFGSQAAATMPLFLLHLLMHGLQFALLPWLAVQLLGDVRPGVAAYLLLAFLPMYTLALQTEVIFQTVILMLAILVPVRRWNAVPSGLLCGLALHISPSIVFVLAGWLWWRRPSGRWMAVWLITLAAALAPWAARNYAALGQVVLVRDNFPLELYVSNNHLASVSMKESRAMRTFHPNMSRTEADAVLRMGEGVYMKDRGRTALRWIISHPKEFASLTLGRVWRYWFPVVPSVRWQGWLVCLVTVLSLPGLFRLRRHRLFLVVMLIAPLLYYVVQADLRYRLPYLWATLLAAGVTIVRVLDHRPAGRQCILEQVETAGIREE